jgi:hypothetical protein
VRNAAVFRLHVNEHLANLDVGVVTEQHFPSALDRAPALRRAAIFCRRI